jgi:hypothetical protein
MIAFCWMDLTQSKLKRPQFVSFQGKMTTKLGEKEKYSHVPQQNSNEGHLPTRSSKGPNQKQHKPDTAPKPQAAREI